MDTIITEAEKYVGYLLTEKLQSGFLYHDLSHTQRVVSKAIELARLSELDRYQKDLLVLSAWFHDTGFIISSDNHEQLSVALAEEFLKKNNVNQSDINLISKTILATKLNYIPTNDLERIIKDADAAYVASSRFFEISTLLRKEWEETLHKKLTDLDWLNVNLNFLTQEHQFHSVIAKEHFAKGKQKNLKEVRLKIKKLKEETI